MLSSPRRPDTTIRICSSAVYCLRVLRRISRTVLSAGSFLLIDFWLIFVPFGHYDEPEILRYAITSIYPKGADVRQFTQTPELPEIVMLSHFGCTCYHPLFVFNQFGDLERCALRPGESDPISLDTELA